MYEIKIMKNGNIKLIKNKYNECNCCSESLKDIEQIKYNESILIKPLNHCSGIIESFHISVVKTTDIKYKNNTVVV